MNSYLFAGYTVIWTIFFFYLIYLHRSQKQTSERLQELQRAFDEFNAHQR